MGEGIIRVRINLSAGELEVEGSGQAVEEWWKKLWPELGQRNQAMAPPSVMTQTARFSGGIDHVPDEFGEFYTQFRSGITDVNRMLIAAAFVQAKDAERVFTTKSANQLLMDQNVKVANASECVRRLVQTKRAFVVSDGRFRVSASGLEDVQSMKSNT